MSNFKKVYLSMTMVFLVAIPVLFGWMLAKADSYEDVWGAALLWLVLVGCTYQLLVNYPEEG